MEKNLLTKEEMVKVKMNALITPIMKYNATTKKHEFVGDVDMRHELAKIYDEEGDTESETKKLRQSHSRLFTLKQAVEYVQNKTGRTFYNKDEIVEMSKKDSEFYLNNFCGGILELRIDNKNVQTQHKYNIDGEARMYKNTELARYEREHKSLPYGELIS